MLIQISSLLLISLSVYGRYLAIPGINFLANAWMPVTQEKLSDTALRRSLTFLSPMSENALLECLSRR